MRQLSTTLLVAVLALSTAACQQSIPLRMQPVSNKKTACIDSQNSNLTNESEKWEPSFKTYTETELLLEDMKNFFSLGSSLESYRSSYENLWSNVQIRPEKLFELDKHLGRMLIGYPRYTVVSLAQNVPWWFIAIVHGLEGGYNFSTHLHNGDKLQARTVRDPAGRPETGNPPFLWEDSARDALGIKQSVMSASWKDPAAIGYAFESYNGFGYRSKGINSPYLWSFSNHYSIGKYVKDGVYSASAVSAQAGSMTILKHAINRGIVNMFEISAPPPAPIQQQYQQKYGNLPPLDTPAPDCANDY